MWKPVLTRTRSVGSIEGATFDNEQGGYKFPADAAIPEISFAVGETLYKVGPLAVCRLLCRDA